MHRRTHLRLPDAARHCVRTAQKSEILLRIKINTTSSQKREVAMYLVLKRDVISDKSAATYQSCYREAPLVMKELANGAEVYYFAQRVDSGK